MTQCGTQTISLGVMIGICQHGGGSNGYPANAGCSFSRTWTTTKVTKWTSYCNNQNELGKTANFHFTVKLGVTLYTKSVQKKNYRNLRIMCQISDNIPKTRWPKEDEITIAKKPRLENSQGRNWKKKKERIINIYLNEQHGIKRTNICRNKISLW